MVHAMTTHCPTLMSMPCPHGHYSPTMCLPQGQHAMFICPDIILFNLCHTCIHHVYTMSVMECFEPNILFFFYLFFFWFYFYFYFYFYFRTMKKTCDKEVTWCDIISLELDGRVWKMISGHLEYTWWPWVGHEAGMRMKHRHKGRVIY